MSFEAEPPTNGALLANVLRFGRILRRLGFAATLVQIRLFYRTLGILDLTNRRDVLAAGQTIFATRREQMRLFELAFDLYFRPPRFMRVPIEALGEILERRPQRKNRLTAIPGTDSPAPPDTDGADARPLLERRMTYSHREVLRHKDFAELTAEEHREVAALIREMDWSLPLRRTRRKRATARGRGLDLKETLRRSLRFGGEVFQLRRQRRKQKERPLVVLCDISGSMEPYSRILLRFVHALGQRFRAIEAFAFGTRLTRITRPLKEKAIDPALKAVSAAIFDWAGGTRMGGALWHFNRDWGRRVLKGGAVVLVMSDGWERGEIPLLEREMERLHRNCHRLIWLNPLLGSPGYEPLTRGMQAALPHVDDFLPVHNLRSLEQLAHAVARLSGSSSGSGWRGGAMIRSL